MANQQMTFLIPPYGRATLSLPEILTSDTFARLDSAINQALRGQSGTREGNPGVAADPGSIECDSWLVDQH